MLSASTTLFPFLSRHDILGCPGQLSRNINVPKPPLILATLDSHGSKRLHHSLSSMHKAPRAVQRAKSPHSRRCSGTCPLMAIVIPLPTNLLGVDSGLVIVLCRRRSGLTQAVPITRLGRVETRRAEEPAAALRNSKPPR